MLSTSLILLTKNEIEGLRQIFPKIDRSLFLEIIAMDGASTDGTQAFYREHGVTLANRGERVAYGDAFRTAADIAKGDAVIFFRPDGNEDPSDLPKLIAKLDAGADHVIASRFMKESRNEEDQQFFKWRAWANRTFTILANLCFRRRGPWITDTINGYRAVRTAGLRAMKLNAPTFSIEYQMTIRSWKLGHKMEEIPTIEGDRIGGKVKAKSFPVGWEMLTTLCKEVLKGRRV
jgi:glycosyltransferase involved in cell wall biosynthesis